MRKIKIMPDRWQQERETTANTAFYDLQFQAFELYKAVEEMQSYNIDPESDQLLEDLKDKLNEIDAIDIEILEGEWK